MDLLHQLVDRWDDALAFLATVLRYLAAVSRTLDEATVRLALSRAVPVNTGEKIMATLAEVWLERGKQEGRLEGRLEGKLEGKLEGREEGETLHARRSLRKLLVSRFGPLPDTVEQRIEQADQSTLDAWFDAALGAPSLESLFADDTGAG